MNRYLYLIKNIGLLTLSNFATRLLSFFLIPLYTNVLTTTEYGTYDLFHTTISLIVPILTFNIQEAVLRFALDEKYSRNAIVTIAVRYFLGGCGVVLVLLTINEIFAIYSIESLHIVLFFLMFFSQGLSGILLAYIRGIDKVAELSISSVLASVITIGCNIIFLVSFKWGLTGYFLANIIGPLIQCLYLLLQSDFLRNIHWKKRFREERKEMLSYSRPLVANSVSWWINSASDRYIVVFFCGLAANGIYSVASKIPSILNIVQTIFNQAWTLSAVKDFDPEDKNGFFTNTYRAYNCLMVVFCSAIIVFDKPLAAFLYAKEFYTAWVYVPWLTIAIVFGALSGYIGGFFSAVKASGMFAQSTVVGAILNLALNIIFTPFMGPLGAAIATTISYFVVWAIRYLASRRFITLKINLLRDIITYVALVVQAVTYLLDFNDFLLYIIECALLLFVVILYMDDILKMYRKILGKIKKLGTGRT